MRAPARGGRHAQPTKIVIRRSTASARRRFNGQDVPLISITLRRDGAQGPTSARPCPVELGRGRSRLWLYRRESWRWYGRGCRASRAQPARSSRRRLRSHWEPVRSRPALPHRILKLRPTSSARARPGLQPLRRQFFPRATWTADSACDSSKAGSPRPACNARAWLSAAITKSWTRLSDRSAYSGRHLYDCDTLHHPRRSRPNWVDEWLLNRINYKQLIELRRHPGADQARPALVGRAAGGRCASSKSGSRHEVKLFGKEFDPGTNPRVDAQFGAAYRAANALVRWTSKRRFAPAGFDPSVSEMSNGARPLPSRP